MAKNALPAIKIIDAGSMAGDLSSTVVNVQYLDNAGLEVTWTGTPTGTIAVQGSISGTTFYALTFYPSLSQPAGSAGGYLINLNQFPFKYYKLTYTRTSGTGSLTVWATVKEV